jgi:hypothetical protein
MRGGSRIGILLSCFILAGVMLVGCGASSSLRSTGTASARSATADAVHTYSATATALSIYCSVPSEGFVYGPPPPSIETPFRSDPTESGERLSGGIVLQWLYWGLGHVQALYIRNAGNIDIPINAADFKAYGYDKPNELVPAVPDPTAQYGGVSPTTVHPGQQIQLPVNSVFTVVIWTIGGKYGTVAVPAVEGFQTPTPTPKPGCH